MGGRSDPTPKFRVTPEECWIWTGAKSSEGYPLIYDKMLGCQTTAARYYYKKRYGQIPFGYRIARDPDKCATGDVSCVNPAHAALTVGKTRLTPDDIRVIRRRRDEGEPLGMIAHDYKTSVSAVSRIAACKTWRHVPGDLECPVVTHRPEMLG